MVKLIFCGAVILLFAIGLQFKNRLHRLRQKELVEGIATPVSQGITQLVGMAGGIYISLVLLISFLSIDIVHQVTVKGFSFDPLAMLSIFIATTQPAIQYLIVKNR